MTQSTLSDHDVPGEVRHEDDRRLVLAFETESVRITRTWRRINDDTIRRRDVEQGYSYTDETWRTTLDHTRDYEVDADGLLVGDGSNWSGEGIHWQAHAKQRHRCLLENRFPRREFGGGGR